ncbi:unnamed protein product, partial [Mesorhabditis belari]|uniref:Uncharacterized protein n=1 Tax=Mesorhabditis belari TaxID=2138241 RepID=A0AAF3E7Y8_9BILA
MLFFLLFSIVGVEARVSSMDPVAFSNSRILKNYWGEMSSRNGYKWKEEWYPEMPIDHFAFANNYTFPLRYFINTESYESGGPILFYTGNEGKLEGFAENTGFMWDIAPEFKAAVVFAEHRFYGKTQPYGNDSYTSTKNLGYLSSEQALADFVVLIDYLKKERLTGATNSPVIAFGGSYGGMLAAWIRVKYPHKVDGAIAASAPVFWFGDSGVQENIYDKIVTRAFVGSGCNFDAVKKGWDAIDELCKTDDGRSFLNNLFHFSSKSRIESSKDAVWLKGYIRETIESVAMVNYPVPTNFLAPLPGWPVKKICRHFQQVAPNDKEAAEQMFEIVNLYYNSTGDKKSFCANPASCDGAFAELGDPLGWPWQTCTEMVMPICGGGPPSDFFWKDCPFTYDGAAENCAQWFGKLGYDKKLFRPHWAIQNYGATFPTATNIVFSNGFLDPWSGGGWALKPKVEGSLVSIILLDGAHHYDLRGAHPQDTAEVKKVREQEKGYIAKWIKEARKRT